MIRRDILPEISTNTHLQTLEGIAYRSFGKPFLLAKDRWTESWPKIIQAVDVKRMSDSLGSPLATMTLVLNQRQSAAEQVRPIIVNMKSAKHLGYAVQWFSMALVRTNNTNSRRA